MEKDEDTDNDDNVQKDAAIWIEKYRPGTFTEIKGQDDIKKKVMAFIKQGNMPHLMFSGPAGTGKSTMAIVVAKKMFGENWRQNFLELNASDERGIDVVRHKVKDFARTRALGNVPFKIIFLDESDALTKEAQQALRRTMENYTTTCRFILSNNYSSKIIDPIQSRCTLFRFKPLEKKDVLAIIENIEEKEKLKIDQKAKEALFEISEGDCRKLENILQSCAALDEKITEELVFSMASIAKPAEVKEILELAVKNRFIDARNKLLDTMLKYGLSGQDIIKQIQKQILELNIDDRMKVQLIDKCGEIEFRMTEGSDEYLQLEALLANFTLCSKKE
ncbi:replication factor C small subunit [Candidatus Woesearchaeota archaeon]|nr:replication factor C small subunit [Candidatus Woesearchaeota archaeon]